MCTRSRFFHWAITPESINSLISSSCVVFWSCPSKLRRKLTLPPLGINWQILLTGIAPASTLGLFWTPGTLLLSYRNKFREASWSSCASQSNKDSWSLLSLERTSKYVVLLYIPVLHSKLRTLITCNAQGRICTYEPEGTVLQTATFVLSSLPRQNDQP